MSVAGRFTGAQLMARPCLDVPRQVLARVVGI